MTHNRYYVIGAYDDATVTYKYFTGIWFKDGINNASLYDANHIDEGLRRVANSIDGSLTLCISKVFTDRNHRNKRLTKMNHYELLAATVHQV